MRYTFYIETDSSEDEEGSTRIYSQATYFSPAMAENRAKEVAALMGGLKFGVEEAK